MTMLPGMPIGQGMAMWRACLWSRNTHVAQMPMGQGIPVVEKCSWCGDALGAELAMRRGCLRDRDAQGEGAWVPIGWECP